MSTDLNPGSVSSEASATDLFDRLADFRPSISAMGEAAPNYRKHWFDKLDALVGDALSVLAARRASVSSGPSEPPNDDSAIRKAYDRLREMTMGAKGDRLDYGAFLSGADATALVGEIERLYANARLDHARLRDTLVWHCLTGIECDHEAMTDVATCGCAKWRSEPQHSVGQATLRWAEHAVAAYLLAARSASSGAPDGRTHDATCYTTKGHHDCAIAEVERLRSLGGASSGGTAVSDEEANRIANEADDLDRFGFVRCVKCKGEGVVCANDCTRCGGDGVEPEVPPSDVLGGTLSETVVNEYERLLLDRAMGIDRRYLAEVFAALRSSQEREQRLMRERYEARAFASRWMMAALYATPAKDGDSVLAFDPTNPEAFAESRRQAIDTLYAEESRLRAELSALRRQLDGTQVVNAMAAALSEPTRSTTGETPK